MQTKCHLSKLIAAQAKKYGDRAALSYRDYDLDKWVDISWNTFAKKVKDVSLALLQAFVQKDEAVSFPVQALDAVSPSPAEQEQCVGEWIQLKLLLLLGLKVVAVVPPVTPLATAHMTASP